MTQKNQIIIVFHYFLIYFLYLCGLLVKPYENKTV